jgi:hypothetical protein
MDVKHVLLILSANFSEAFLSVRTIQKISPQMYTGLHAKYPVILFRSQKKLNLSTNFREILKYQISSKNVQWWPRRFHAYRQTYTTKLTDAIAILRT